MREQPPLQHGLKSLLSKGDFLIDTEFCCVNIYSLPVTLDTFSSRLNASIGIIGIQKAPYLRRFLYRGGVLSFYHLLILSQNA